VDTKKKEIIELKKIEKWDGKLPQFYGSTMPMMSMLNQ